MKALSKSVKIVQYCSMQHKTKIPLGSFIFIHKLECIYSGVPGTESRSGATFSEKGINIKW